MRESAGQIGKGEVDLPASAMDCEDPMFRWPLGELTAESVPESLNLRARLEPADWARPSQDSPLPPPPLPKLSAVFCSM